MDAQKLRDTLWVYIMSSLPIDTVDEIEDIDDNPGGFWINLKNGETYFLMVGKCETDAGSDAN